MKRTRRNHAAAYKAKVALAALKGDKTLAELSQQFDVHINQITQWKGQLLERASEVFVTAADRTEAAGPGVKERHTKIGQLAMANDCLAGALGHLGGREKPSDDRALSRAACGPSPCANSRTPGR